jgi:hypothetical protein
MKDKGYVKTVLLDHLLGWQVAMVMKQAIENGQSLDTTVVRDAFQKMTKIDILYGTAKMGDQQTFGINNLLVGPYPLTKIMNGQMQFIKYCTPDIP